MNPANWWFPDNNPAVIALGDALSAWTCFVLVQLGVVRPIPVEELEGP